MGSFWGQEDLEQLGGWELQMVGKASGISKFQFLSRNLEVSLPSAELRFLLPCPRQPRINSTQQLHGSPCCVQSPDGVLDFLYLFRCHSQCDWVTPPPQWVCSVSHPKIRQEEWSKCGVSEVCLSFINWANSEQAAFSKYRTRGSEVQEGRREYSGPSMNTLVKMLIF